MKSSAVRLTLVAICALNTACAFARLDKVWIDGQAATAAQREEVTVVRHGQPVPTQKQANLEKGDEIETGPNATALVVFGGGQEAVLGPHTKVEIQNPSLNVAWSDFLFLRGRFTVKTKLVTAATRGTAFVMRVEAKGGTKVTVLEGKVECSGAWAPVELGPGEQLSVRASGEKPSKTQMPRDEYNRLIEKVNQFERPGQKRLPDVVDRDQDTALRVLEQAGFQTRVTREPAAPAQIGKVLRQNPAAGENARGLVELAIGVRSTRVPDVSRMSLARATKVLQSQELSVGTVGDEITGSAPAGTVLRQTPSPSSAVAVDSAVDLVVEAESIAVPQVEGMSADRARQMLQNAGLSVGTERERLDSARRSGVVLRQDPAAGTPVRRGAAVDLEIAVAGVVVPDIRGSVPQRAAVELGNLGLGIGSTRQEQSSRHPAGTIVSQSPAPGTAVARGTAVDVTVAVPVRGPSTAPPTNLPNRGTQPVPGVVVPAPDRVRVPVVPPPVDKPDEPIIR